MTKEGRIGRVPGRWDEAVTHSYLHSRGLVHFDVKPNNVLVADLGIVKLLDLGISGAPSDELRDRARPMGRRPHLVRGKKP